MLTGGLYGIFASASSSAATLSGKVLLTPFGTDEAIAINVANNIAKRGWYDVIVHGTADGLGFTIEKETLTAEQLYAKMHAAGYQQGT